MTRLLYIPSGEYVKFVKWMPNGTSGNTEIFEESITRGIVDSVETYIELTIQHNYSAWLRANFGDIKFYREEFEVIYD